MHAIVWLVFTHNALLRSLPSWLTGIFHPNQKWHFHLVRIILTLEGTLCQILPSSGQILDDVHIQLLSKLVACLNFLKNKKNKAVQDSKHTLD